VRTVGATAAVLAALATASSVQGAEPLWSEPPARHRPAPALAALADRARPAVVHVRGTLGESPKGQQGGMVSVGSGFFIARSGYIVTNEHVVRGTVDIRIRLQDGREMVACVVGADPATDLALLKVEPKTPVAVLPLGDSDAVRVGETAVAIGSPFGFSHSVTAGIVSAKERVIDRASERDDTGESTGEGAYSFFIQTDASINVGNSGGPLLDASGAVIGINAAFWGGGQAAQGVSFAIPINIAKMLVPRLRAEGAAPRSFLGVESQPLTASMAEALGLGAARGALIAGVLPGSAAEAGGLEPGDVVLGWDRRPVASAEDFKIYTQLTPPGAKVHLKVLREGKTAERVVVPRRADAAVPASPHAAACKALPPGTPPSRLPDGFQAADLPASRAHGLPGGRGVEVAKVEGGAAREAGLAARDVVLRVGRTVVHSADELRRALAAASSAAPVMMLVRRDGADFWTALPRR
jgi:serine protease Do